MTEKIYETFKTRDWIECIKWNDLQEIFWQQIFQLFLWYMYWKTAHPNWAYIHNVENFIMKFETWENVWDILDKVIK